MQEEQWYQLHEETEFTEEEFNHYKEEKVTKNMSSKSVQIRSIRKMIADGVLPENYNYHDVPLLNGEMKLLNNQYK